MLNKQRLIYREWNWRTKLAILSLHGQILYKKQFAACLLFYNISKMRQKLMVWYCKCYRCIFSWYWVQHMTKGIRFVNWTWQTGAICAVLSDCVLLALWIKTKQTQRFPIVFKYSGTIFSLSPVLKYIMLYTIQARHGLYVDGLTDNLIHKLYGNCVTLNVVYHKANIRL